MKNNEQYIDEIFQKYDTIKNSKEKKSFKNSFVISPMNTFLKIVTIMTSFLAITGCAAFATHYIIGKVFKEPKIMTYQESISVNEGEKSKLIDENQAIDMAYKELQDKFNKTPGNITEIKLQKDISTYEPIWIIFYDNSMNVQVNAISGKIINLSDWTIDDTKVKSKLSKDEAKIIANELYHSLGYKDEEYELASFKKSAITDDTNLYTADFSKKYGNIYNDFQTVRITFIPEIKQIVIFVLFDYKFDNNEQVITKEQAIEIAKQKNNSLNNGKDKIKNEEAELKIVKSNEYIYAKEHPINNSDDEEYITNETKIVTMKDLNDFEVYLVEPRTRFAWSVKIEYESDIDLFEEYYIDATTGEIIGGDGTK